MEIVICLLLLVAGALVGYIIGHRIISKQLKALQFTLQENATHIADLARKDEFQQTKIADLHNEVSKKEALLAQNLTILNERNISFATLEERFRLQQEKLQQQAKDLEAMQQRLTVEFENIANRVMKQRSEEFSLTHQRSLKDILDPLKERIVDFERKVDENYALELREKLRLSEELKNLTELNVRISQEANNLTRALKGDVKKQGNWGEIVLERVLERSGLTNGQEYQREVVLEGSEAQVQRPDVIVHLPDKKHIVIDSKVSLVAYERFVSANDELSAQLALKEHIVSLRTHVKTLSDKNYQNANNINTPDFVLMFMPIEAAFSVAVQTDAELFSYAWERNIVVVSPTTLLATLRTIASIWKQENQTRNAQEIARLSGSLYDKFVGFIEDLERIKKGIEQTSKAYDDAVKKLRDGRGNIINTSKKIKELGAKTGNKELPHDFDVNEVD
jgi:DNA recombination protein RmuC